ncbi:MAG: GTP cyclohydrolase, FolE2/MptA family [Candidatus Altiarchaeota archaeon]
MKDTQDKKPNVERSLDRVGITNLRTLIHTTWGGQDYRFTPKIEITIDLEKGKKGIHMSRLVEAIGEAVEEETQKPGSSIEEIEKRILERLLRRHPYRRGEVRMETDLIVEKRTPVSGLKTTEAHKVEVTVAKDNGRYSKKLKATVLGNTVCPHSMETAGKPHIQRAVGELEVETGYGNYVDLEDMIECVEGSFSSEVYTLLKTEDERHVVEKMFKNPKFVEDVVRDILHDAKKRFRGCRIKSKVISYESIHRHDVIAEGSC